ncbi:hypothetical protein LPJ79_004576 [Coemansia sp. RSA 1821]|nr:hypothetical protein LPJ79_004576 [Coemansia sp. RSA 1821]
MPVTVVQRPLVIKEVSASKVSRDDAVGSISKFLNSEAGVQSASTSTIQQLMDLQKNMFGTGGGFGGSGTSGGFGSFGQSSQSKPAFGGFGQSSNSGTGGFGSSSNTGFGSGGSGGFGRSTGFGSSTGGFGGSSTAVSGGSAFGGTGGFGSTGGFGQSSQTNTTSGAFGGGFGSSVSATGTARADFAPLIENTTAGKRDYFNHICFMDAYKGFSPEELRLQDYEAGRKTADAAGTAGGSAFGQPAATGGGFGSGFGSTATSKPATGGFGSFASGSGIGGFGQANNTASTGMFGSTANKPTGFGQTSGSAFGSGNTTGGFGSTTGGFGSTTTGGGFGSSGTATGGGFGQTSSAGTGGFGQTAASTGGGFGSGTSFGAKPAFGSGSSGGGFGATATSQPAASSGFGQTSGFGQASGFGQNTGGFGQTGGTSSMFGGGSTGGGMFGAAAAATSAAPASTGMFGSSGGTSSMFGSKPAASTGGGMFGSSGTAAPGGMFGSAANNTAAGTAGGGGLFGASTNAAGNTGAAGTSSGLFGGSGATGGSLFGAKPAASGTGTGGGLFGNTGANQQAGASTGLNAGGGGLFGNTAGSGTSGGGLFGASTNAAGNAGAAGAGSGLFGSSGATGGSLFGAKPAASGTSTGGGLFSSTGGTAGSGFGFGSQGSSLQQGQTTGQSQLFGAQPQQQQQQQLQLQSGLQAGQLAAQIDRQPYGISALFDTSKLANKAATKLGSSHLTATPLRASSVVAQNEKETERKKRGLNLQLLSSPHVSSAVSSRLRLRGFAAPTASTVRRSASKAAATPAAQIPKTPGAKGLVEAGLFGRDGFLSPERHSSVKRLVITRKPSFGGASDRSAQAASPKADSVEGTPVRERAATTALLTSPPKMGNPWAEMDGALKRRSVTAAEAEAEAEAQAQAEAEAEAEAEVPSDVESDSGPEDGGYWMRPPLDDLRAMTTQQLRAVRNFAVGRTGVGQVSFNRPVDLTSVGSLSTIPGGVILFEDRVCTVYPDESNKPPRGQGLNVPATISLHDCWPVDRTSGASIEQMGDPRVRKHIRRLRRIAETEFVDFVNGTWIFRVEHFSRYGLDDNREDGYDSEDMAGFEEATAAPAAMQMSQLDGSRAVANSTSNTTGSESGSEAMTDILDAFETDQPTQHQSTGYVPPPPFPGHERLLRGGRHAAALRRAPVMRASLFAAAPPPADAANRKRGSDAAMEQDPPKPHAHRPFSRKRTRRRSAAAAAGAAAGKMSSRAMSMASSAGTSIEALDLPPPSKFLRGNEARMAQSVLAARPPYARSLTHGRSGDSADAGLMMARSFRVAFGGQGQLVYLRGGAHASVVVVDRLARHIHAAADTHDDVVALHEATARAQWSFARTSSEPSIEFCEDTTVASVASRLDAAAAAAAAALPIAEKRLLELATVLFDQQPASESGDDEAVAEHARLVRQKQGVTRWLEGAVASAVQHDLAAAGRGSAPAAMAVFALLTGHRIEAACLAAAAHRDYRLATLVAQCGSGGNDHQVQALVRAQLESSTFGSEYQRVYSLLAGSALDVAHGLDWKRAFGLVLWFAQSPADGVGAAVRLYQQMIADSNGASAALPLPVWADDEQRRLELQEHDAWDGEFQLLRLFSDSACALEQALPSESFTNARGDVRLPALLAWLLFVVKRRRGFDGGKSAYDRLLAAWAFQLETLGLWHWSCFVLLQLSSVPYREHAIKALLARALPCALPTPALMPAVAGASSLLPAGQQQCYEQLVDRFEEQVRFVLQELHIPPAWLFAAYATRARYDRDWIDSAGGTLVLGTAANGLGHSAPLFGSYSQTRNQFATATPGAGAGAGADAALQLLDTSAEAVLREFAWLVSAGQTAAAHALVLQRIAPDAVLRGEYRLLKQVLELLTDSTVLPVPRDEWAAGGHIYLSFIAAVDELPQILSRMASADPADDEMDTADALRVQDIYTQMVALLTAIPALKSRFDAQPALPSAAMGILDAGGHVNWFTGSAASELHVKYSVAISEMASIATGLLQELEKHMPELIASDSALATSMQQRPVAGSLAMIDSSQLPMAQDMRILRTYQLAKSCFGSLVSNQLEA